MIAITNQDPLNTKYLTGDQAPQNVVKRVRTKTPPVLDKTARLVLSKVHLWKGRVWLAQVRFCNHGVHVDRGPAHWYFLLVGALLTVPCSKQKAPLLL